MTRQVRALAVLTAGQGAAYGQALQYVARPRVLECTLDVIAIVQVTTALVAVLVTQAGAALPTAQVAALLATSLVACILLVRGRRTPPARLIGHAALLVAAWQARPFLDAAAASEAALWLRAWWQAVFVHAFLPLAVWRLAHECAPPVRFSWFERVSSMALTAALACSLCLAAACALPVLIASGPQAVDGPRLIAVVSLAWAVMAACTIAARTRRVARLASSPGTAPTRRAWRSRLRARAAAVGACLRGTGDGARGPCCRRASGAIAARSGRGARQPCRPCRRRTLGGGRGAGHRDVDRPRGRPARSLRRVRDGLDAGVRRRGDSRRPVRQRLPVAARRRSRRGSPPRAWRRSCRLAIAGRHDAGGPAGRRRATTVGRTRVATARSWRAAARTAAVALCVADASPEVAAAVDWR